MIIQKPKSKIEKDIYNIISTREDFLRTKIVEDKDTKEKKIIPIWSEGEKAILYDLCTKNISSLYNISFYSLGINYYIDMVKAMYKEHQNYTIEKLVNNVANTLGLEAK